MNRPSSLPFVLILVLTVVTAGPAPAATVSVIGANGTPGTDGNCVGCSGSPGGAGAPASANSTTVNTDPGNVANATGGSGGTGGGGGAPAGAGGDGGAGGDAVATASTTVATGDATAQVTVIGGTGNSGGSSGSPAGVISGNGGDGGGATGSAIAINTGNGKALATAQVNGGRGGGAGGQPYTIPPLCTVGAPCFSAIDGDGGVATLGSVFASSNGGSATAEGTVIGGAAGTSGGAPLANGGSGASVSLIDAVDGSTTGALTLRQYATGGMASQNVEVLNGVGGSAFSSLTKTTSSTSLALTVRATGGGGGSRTREAPLGLPHDVASVAAVGGDGFSVGSGTNVAGTSSVFAFGIGGLGGSALILGLDGGRGGDGNASAVSKTVGNGHAANAQATATGGNGGSSIGGAIVPPIVITTYSGRGGDAEASTSAIALGNAPVSAYAKATGGNSGSAGIGGPGVNAALRGEGGDARATAIGQGGDQPIAAQAIAIGGNGAGHDALALHGAGTAQAFATGIGTGNVTAVATATAGKLSGPGRDAKALARASASGASGTATAKASNGVASQKVVAVNTGAVAQVGSTVTTEARTAVGDAPFDPSSMTGLTAAAYAVAAPSGSENFLGTVLFGTEYVGSGATKIYTTSASFDLDLSRFDPDEEFLLDLTTLQTTGFDSLRLQVHVGGPALFDRTFVSAGDVLASFEVPLLLGHARDFSSASPLQLALGIDITSHSIGDGLRIGFAMLDPNPVPLPGTFYLLGPACAALLGHRRNAMKRVHRLQS